MTPSEAHAKAGKLRRAKVAVPEALLAAERPYWNASAERRRRRAGQTVNWTWRTVYAARAELARRHRAEYEQILAEIRQRDPKPEAKAQEAATEAAA